MALAAKLDNKDYRVYCIRQIQTIRGETMADGYLETHQRDYEKRKTAWLRKKAHLQKQQTRQIAKPDDEAL